MTTRTVIVNGKRLEKLLSDRVSSPQKLAEDCECHVKTVMRALNGKPVLRSTVREIAVALKVEPQTLLAWDEPDDREPSQVIEFVIRGHRRALEQSSVFLDFIALLAKLLGQPSEIKFRTYEAGCVRFAAPARKTAAVAARFDEFEEHAFELIRQTETGRSFFRGGPLSPEQAERVRGLIELVESVAELRFSAQVAGDRSASTAPYAAPAPPAGHVTPAYRPLLPPDVPASNMFLQKDKGELVQLYGEALSAPPGPERDYRLLKIAEAMEYAEAVERHESLPRNG